MRDGIFHGHGILITSTGDKFEGEFNKGKLDGLATHWSSQNGSFYDGEWKNGKINGYGVSTTSNGYRYEG